VYVRVYQYMVLSCRVLPLVSTMVHIGTIPSGTFVIELYCNSTCTCTYVRTRVRTNKTLSRKNDLKDKHTRTYHKYNILKTTTNMVWTIDTQQALGSGATGKLVYSSVPWYSGTIHSLVLVFQVMLGHNFLIGKERAHMCTENHVVCFGRIHGSQLREGANAGQHTPTLSLPPSHRTVRTHVRTYTRSSITNW
jgi:hypothetical protein